MGPRSCGRPATRLIDRLAVTRSFVGPHHSLRSGRAGLPTSGRRSKAHASKRASRTAHVVGPSTRATATPGAGWPAPPYSGDAREHCGRVARGLEAIHERGVALHPRAGEHLTRGAKESPTGRPAGRPNLRCELERSEQAVDSDHGLPVACRRRARHQGRTPPACPRTRSASPSALRPARSEPRRPRGDVEMQAKGAGPVESERAVDLEEVEVGAHLDWPIAGVLDGQLDRPAPGVDLDRAGAEIESADVGVAHDHTVHGPSRSIRAVHAARGETTGSAGGRSRAWCRRETAPPLAAPSGARRRRP